MKSASRISARATEGKSSRASSSRSNKFPPGEYSIHTAKQCDQLLNNRPIHLKRCTYDGKEASMLRMITILFSSVIDYTDEKKIMQITRVPEKEGYRKLLVPSKEPSVYPKIITSSEFSSLVERSHIPTKEEREAALTAAERERERLLRYNKSSRLCPELFNGSIIVNFL